jgi:hypothetical protein
MAGQDDEDLKHVMGGRFQNAKKLTPQEAHAPSKPVAPKRPEPKPGDRQPTPTPFPILSQEEVAKKQNEPARAEDAFAGATSRRFDPELNELALKQVAEERGITVEELLKSQGRKLEGKVEPMSEPKEQTFDATQLKKLLETAEQAKVAVPPAPVDTITSEDELLALELEELELKKKELELRRKLGHQATASKTPEASPAAKKVPLSDPNPASAAQMQASTPGAIPPKKSIHNAVLQKMRERLSMEMISPAVVEIEGIEFELLPPKSDMYGWAMEKLKDAAYEGQDAVKIALRVCTAATSLVRVEKLPIAEVLNLVPEGTVGSDPYKVSLDIRKMTAQALWEMLHGDTTIEGSFQFNPAMSEKLNQACDVHFKNLNLTSSLDPKMRHFECSVPDCTESYDLALESGNPAFCQIHGIPMNDKGLSSETKNLAF